MGQTCVIPQIEAPCIPRATVPSERPAARTVLRRVADPRRYFETVFGRVDAESRTHDFNNVTTGVEGRDSAETLNK